MDILSYIQTYNTEAVRVGLAVFAAVTLALQTWLSFYVSTSPIENSTARRLVTLGFALAGVAGVGALAANVYFTDTMNSQEAGTLKLGLKAVSTGVAGVDDKMNDMPDKVAIAVGGVLDIKMQDACLSPAQVSRMLVLLRLRDQYFASEQGKNTPGLWPPERWLNDQLAKARATWRVRVSGADIEAFSVDAAMRPAT